MRASYFGVYASTPRMAVGGTPEHEDALVAQLRGTLERLQERLVEAREHATESQSLVPTSTTSNRGNTTVTPANYAEAAEHEIARLEALFDDAFVVLPPLSLPNQPETSATLSETHTEELLSTADAMAMPTETWLQRMARVRERPALFRQSLSYAEMLTDRLIHDDLRVGQVPYEPSDDWVGLEGVTPDGGTVSLVTHFANEASNSADRPITPNPGTGEGQNGAQLAALRIDEWRTEVPSETETTGVALNYDDPEIRLEFANGLYHAAYIEGKTGEFDEFDEMRTRFDRLAD